VRSDIGRIASPRELEPASVDPVDETLTGTLNRHLRRSGLSLTALARRSRQDMSYVSRLVNLPCDRLNRAAATGARSGIPAATPSSGWDWPCSCPRDTWISCCSWLATPRSCVELAGSPPPVLWK
jgi:hypothetical protein